MTGVAGQMAARRELILAAAREIIGERGYRALTMRDLARASGVTVPTVYNLIGGKQDVLFAAVADQTARFVAVVERVEAASPAARVLSVVDAAAGELLRLPRYYRTLLGLLFTSGSRAAKRARAEVECALRWQLERGVQELRARGELARWVDPAALIERLLGHLAWTSLQWAAGELDAASLRGASLYELCLVLLAVTDGRSRGEFERVAREVQPSAPNPARLRAPARRADPEPTLAPASRNVIGGKA